MRKYLSALLALTLVFALAACGGSPAPSAPAAPASAAPASAAPSAAAPAAPTATYIELAEDLGAEEYGIGFRNSDIALGLEVQKMLDAMIADGKAAEISEKWFGTDVLFKDKSFLEETQAPATDKSLEAVKAAGKLIVGLDDSYPPMGYRNDKNEVVGFDIDLATEVASRMGIEVVFQSIDWASKEMELDSKRIDCIWNGMTITEERIAGMFFAKPYIANQQIIVVPADSGITTIAQLEGKTIGLQEGSSSVQALEANPIRAKVKEVVEYPENMTAYTDLKTGRIDVFVVDSVVGRYMLSQDAAK
ncbi:MAG: transporter substrate-binding domain-containing protein [Oscillospiraceae bacterium]